MLSFSEELPDPNNRVTLDWTQKDTSGQPRLKINFSAADYSVRGVTHVVEKIWDIAKASGKFKVVSQRHDAGSVHITGTAVMGNDPATSVVDSNCRAHDHPNLFIVGGGVFPSSGTVNPTLTIAALSLRAAKAIAAAR